MKSRRERTKPSTVQAPVTFHDIAACFSEVEWKLFHHWQKDLLKNVMKDIHQTLLSLGPLIATTVFSLKPKEKEEECFVDSQALEIKGSMDISPSPLIATSVFSLKPEEMEDTCFMESQALEIRRGVDISPTDSTTCSEVLISKRRKTNQYLKEAQDTDQREHRDDTMPGLADKEHIGSFTIKGEQMDSLDHLISKRRDCITSAIGPEATTLVTSIGINEEGETYQLGLHDYRRRESINSPADARNVKRQSRKEESIKYCEQNIASEAPFRKAQVIQESEQEPNSRRQLWTESNCKLEEEKNSQCASSLLKDTHSSLHQTSLKASDTNNGCENNVWNAKNFLGQESMQNRWGTLNYLESENMLMQNINVLEHQRIHTNLSLKERYFQCAECKRSFSQKVHLIRHQRTHSGERPYQCTECGKSFGHKHILLGHLRKHSGERPFQCTTCLKSFIWKQGLRRHQRTHTSRT
ncbi:zinc finger protein 282-like isoform X2 [Ambystoma mexicanum]|uniref:zinc finger protein 282-like isoform X2 n=1 Tax=Ambystoma mexicanum TaxID=8296 RepID=UPI0037E7995C